MSDNIPLTKDGGLDPRLTYCPRCKCDTPEIIVGDNRLVTNEDTGQKAIVPRDRVAKMARENGWTNWTKGPVPEGPLPSTSLCDSCEKEVEEHAEIVAAGGLYWRCEECNQEGVIKDSDFSRDIRKENNVQPPDPLGVSFVNCAQHTPEESG